MICKKDVSLYNVQAFIFHCMNLTIFIVALSVLLIILVMIQSKGTGLSIVNGSQDFGKFERRGGEKVLHQITIGLVALYTILAIAIYMMA